MSLEFGFLFKYLNCLPHYLAPHSSFDCVYLPASLSAYCLFTSLRFSLPVVSCFPPVCLIYLPFLLPLYLSSCLHVYLFVSIYWFVFLFTFSCVYLLSCLPEYLSPCHPAYLNVCPPTSWPAYLLACLLAPVFTFLLGNLNTCLHFLLLT